MSKQDQRPRALKFVDVSGAQSGPGWIASDKTGAASVGNDNRIKTLHPPEVSSPEQPQNKLAPLLESLLPPVLSIAPPAMSTQQASPSIPAPPGVPAFHKTDTLIEELIPRAEEEAAAAIVRAVESFTAARKERLEAAEEDLVSLVRVISERVIAREIQLDPTICRSLVHEGLAALGEADRIWIRLGPFFADAVHELSFDLEEKGINAQIRVDPSVGLHGCQIETELGHVDESVESRIERLLGGLISETSAAS